MKVVILGAVVGGLLMASAAQAAIRFSYGPLVELESQNQFGLPVFVSTDAGDAPVNVTGVQFVQIINDGGTLLGNLATPPKYAFATLKPSGGLFVNFTEAEGGFRGEQVLDLRLASIGTPPNVVTIDATPRLLAAVAFDTTGLVGNTFTLSNFGPGADGPTFSKFSVSGGGGTEANVAPSTVVITVPEPAALGVFAFVGVGLLARRRAVA